MSKKMAESLNALSLDVKFGSGAFMRTKELAEALSKSLCRVGESFGVKTTARINDMNFPTGEMVGNLNEVIEAINVLKNEGPSDTRDLTLDLCSDLLISCDLAENHQEARSKLSRHLSDGSAYERFEQMVIAQGGRIDQLPSLANATDYKAKQNGKLGAVNCYALGMSVIAMGGGRSEVGQTLDHRTGLKMIAKPNTIVRKGDPLCTVYCDDEAKLQTAIGWLDAPISYPEHFHFV